MALQTNITHSKSKFTNVRSSASFITCVVAFAVFTEAFLYAILDVIFPYSLVNRNHLAKDNVQPWVEYLFTAEAVGVLIGAPIFGWLSDHIADRKRPLLFGSVILLVAHVTLCFASSLAALIVGRVLQGISAGAVWCLGLALLADICPENSVGKMMGYATAAYSVGGFVAPFVGGVLYKYAGYYAVFGVGFGLITIDTVLRILLVEPKKLEEDTNNYTTSTSPSILPSRTPISALSEQKIQSNSFDMLFAHDLRDSPSREDSISTEGTLCTNTSSTLTEPQDMPESPRRNPLMTLLLSRRTLINFAINTINSMILSGLDVTLALFVEGKFHWDAQGAGLIYIALALPTILQMIYGSFVDKVGCRLPATIGLLIGIAPFACFRFVEQNTLTHKILLGVLIFVIGFGLSLTLAANMTEFTNIAKEKEKREPGSMGSGGAVAQSTSLFNISWALGAIAGSNFAGQIHKRAGWGTMGTSYAALSGAAVLPTLLFLGGWIGQRSEGATNGRKERADTIESLVC